MTKLNSRAIKAIEILETGGYWQITSGVDYFGKPVMTYILRGNDDKRVKGFGAAVFRNLKEFGLLNVDADSFDEYGTYKLA